MSVAKLKEQDDLVADIKAILTLLKEREWAEHCTKSRPGRELESLITDMHNEIAELQQKLDALADKLARSEDYSIGVDAERMEYIEKFNAMAAENAALMKFCKNAAFDADYESELGMERGGFTDAINDIKTPATDAYLNSVRAEALKMAIDHMNNQTSDDCADVTVLPVIEMYKKLISGTHGTADKAG